MKKQQGSILVFVVLTVAVLMIFGATFATITTAEYRAAMHHTHGVQAFNVAEAGLNWAKHGLQNGSLVPPRVGETKELYRSPAFGGLEEGELRDIYGELGGIGGIGGIMVEVSRLTETRIELIVQGKKAQARRTLAITAYTGVGAPETVLSRHHVEGTATLHNYSELVGDIHAAIPPIVRGDAEFEGRYLGPSLVRFNPPTFALPTGLTERGAVNVPAYDARALPGSGSYPSITVRTDGVLMIHVPDAQDVIIRVNTLILHDDASIHRTGHGTGRILLHVAESVQFGDDVSVNESMRIDRFILFYHGTAPLILGGPTGEVAFYGIVVTNTASVTIGGDAALTGHLITGGDSLVIDNDAAIVGVVYASEAAVTIRVDGSVEGTVIARTLTMRTDAAVERPEDEEEEEEEEEYGLGSFLPMIAELGLWSTARFEFRNWGMR